MKKITLLFFVLVPVFFLSGCTSCRWEQPHGYYNQNATTKQRTKRHKKDGQYYFRYSQRSHWNNTN